MSEYSEIREKLERLAGKCVKFHVAEVVSVENDTCTIAMGDTTISDVRLCATLTRKTFSSFPKWVNLHIFYILVSEACVVVLVGPTFVGTPSALQNPTKKVNMLV